MQGMRIALAAVLCAHALAPAGAAGQGGRRAQERIDEALRRESEALVELADAAAAGRSVPADYALEWHSDFFKAQPGTFVPFTVSFLPASASRSALLYVRAERQGARAGAPFAYETIFPVRLDAPQGQPVSVTRGFAVPPGRYRVVLVLRDSQDDPAAAGVRRAGVLLEAIEVPDFWTGELATSTIMLADRLEPLPAPVPADQLDEDPYAVGTNRIHVTRNRTFRRENELIVAFLIYNLAVGPDNQFDLQVDYHLYKKIAGGEGPPGAAGQPPARPGERYVTRTNPQRFNPSMMGPRFDPAAGTPLLAGQGILLRGFEPGDYRLAITVTDLLGRRSLSRDVAFTVAGS